MQVKRRVVLHFPQQKVDQPVICYLTRDHNLLFNILRASITPEDVGLMVLELIGAEATTSGGLPTWRSRGSPCSRSSRTCSAPTSAA